MKGTGMQELFSEVYAEISVVHMMSGKAFSRALRAHFLTESTLTTLLIEMLVAEGNNSLSDFKEILSIIPDEPELGKKQELFDSKTFSDFTAALENLFVNHFHHSREQQNCGSCTWITSES